MFGVGLHTMLRGLGVTPGDVPLTRLGGLMLPQDPNSLWTQVCWKGEGEAARQEEKEQQAVKAIRPEGSHSCGLESSILSVVEKMGRGVQGGPEPLN